MGEKFKERRKFPDGHIYTRFVGRITLRDLMAYRSSAKKEYKNVRVTHTEDSHDTYHYIVWVNGRKK